jgi:flagellar basal body rod protein FlgC
MSFQQGLSGLNATSKNLEVIGNNVANSQHLRRQGGAVPSSRHVRQRAERRRRQRGGHRRDAGGGGAAVHAGQHHCHRQPDGPRHQRRRLLPGDRRRQPGAVQPQRPVQGRPRGLHRQQQARYSNGQNQPAGQIELATFRNPQGLQPLGGNAWARSSTSGDPVVGVPGDGNLGVLQAGALEESNVDLTGELVNMITAQRIYQANAQTIKTQDQVLQTLVKLR